MKLTFSSIQWTIFILAGTLVAPISIGFAFGMSQPEIAGLLQRTFFIIGLTSLLQAFFGHKLPLVEGPAGLWWGVFLVFAAFAASTGQSAGSMLQSLEMGLLITGVLFLLLSLFKLVNVIKKWFTPLVTGTYLIFLVAELSGPFVKGMLGIGYLSPGVNVTVALSSLGTLIFSVVLAKSSSKLINNYFVLLSLAFGWALFYLLGITKPFEVELNSSFKLPEVLAWGAPTFQLGVILTSLLTAFLLLANLITSVDVIAHVVEKKEAVDYNRSAFVMGMNQLLAGVFSTMGGVPIAASAGFIVTTKIKDKLPFMIGSAIIMIMSFFPVIMSFFVSLPVPVGYATLFLSISSLMGLGLQEVIKAWEKPQSRFIISLSLMAGFGIMFVPNEAWTGLPSAVTLVVSNGLAIGVLTCIVLEQLLKREGA